MSPSVAAFSALSPPHTALPTIAPLPAVPTPVAPTDCRLTGSAMVLGLRRCGDGTVVVVVEEGEAVGDWLHLDRGFLLLALLGASAPIGSHPSRRTKLHLARINLMILEHDENKRLLQELAKRMHTYNTS